MNIRTFLSPRYPTQYRKPCWLARTVKLLGHYRYYRKQNYRHAMAWRLARNTL